jgi:hypothetical protein
MPLRADDRPDPGGCDGMGSISDSLVIDDGETSAPLSGNPDLKISLPAARKTIGFLFARMESRHTTIKLYAK